MLRLLYQFSPEDRIIAFTAPLELKDASRLLLGSLAERFNGHAEVVQSRPREEIAARLRLGPSPLNYAHFTALEIVRKELGVSDILFNCFFWNAVNNPSIILRRRSDEPIDPEANYLTDVCPGVNPYLLAATTLMGQRNGENLRTNMPLQLALDPAFFKEGPGGVG